MSRSAPVYPLPDGPKAPRREHGIHDRILAESARLFLSKGFENVSVEEIITAAGVARSSFYRFFANREEVLSSIIRPLFEKGIECLQAIEPGDADEVFHGIFETYLTLWHMSRDALRLSTRTGGVYFDLFRDLHGPFRDRLVELVAGVDPRALANRNADFTARLIARTSVPVLEVYAGAPNFVTLYHRTMRGLLLAPEGSESC